MSKTTPMWCGSVAQQPSRRDSIYGALALIGGSLLFSAAGIVAKRTGFETAGETLVSIAFPASILFALPFLYLKGRSWRVQLVFVGLPLLLLVAIAFLANLL